MNILFIDDHPIMREGVSSLLKKENPQWEILTAEDELKAFEILKSTPEINLIILDMNLNGKNGLDFISDFKSINNQIKILIYTTYVEPLHICQALKSGINGYVTKGASTEELIRAVKAMEFGGTYYNKETEQIVQNILTENKSAIDSEHSELFARFKELSDKDKTLFNLLATKLEIGEIAKQLGVSEKTISNRRSILYSKMNIRDRLELIEKAKTLGVIL